MATLTFDEKNAIHINIPKVPAQATLVVLAQHIVDAIGQKTFDKYGLVPKAETISREDAVKSDDIMALDQTDKGRLYIATRIANDIIQYAQISPEDKLCGILARNVLDKDVMRTMSESRSIHAYAHNLLQFPYERLRIAIKDALFNK